MSPFCFSANSYSREPAEGSQFAAEARQRQSHNVKVTTVNARNEAPGKPWIA
jgi:hypothetical protein